MRSSWLVLGAAALACTHPSRSSDPIAPATRTLTIIGTNDLHGALERLPLLAGFIANVRAVRAADGGAVLLVDAGDLFQGTLESNLAEGADVVRAYNEMHYAATAVGNHEFDYGPAGPAVTVRSSNDDPRGALEARMREATFPFLTSNIVDATGERFVRASTMVELAGTKIGIVGASTESTPYTTMPANFVGLRVTPVAQSIASEAKALRDRGAQLVIVIAHLGSECKVLDHSDDPSTCDRTAELVPVLDALPKGLVDVFVAGHTHAAVAHKIDGIAVIESYSSGRAFGRVDVRITSNRVDSLAIFKPELMCPLDRDRNPIPVADCHPPPYEGKPVVPDPQIQHIVDEAIARAGQRRDEKLGVTLAATVTKAYGVESPEGDLVTDLMLAAEPRAQVALTNGGGLRADLPAGELTYGQLFEAMPFDNRFALVDVIGAQLRDLVSSNLQRGGGIFSWGGLAAMARCKDGKLAVEIEVGGKPLADAATYTLATSDFLASGGDGVIGRLALPAGAIRSTDVIIREAVADVLRKQRGTIDPVQIHKRLDFVGKRPVHCEAP